MKATISEDRLTIHLPVKIGTAVFIHEEDQHDGAYVMLKKYDYYLIGRNVYSTEEEAKRGEY